MTRALTTAVKNELATSEITPIHLLTINFSTPVNLTDNSFNLTSSISGSSTTYTASSFLVSTPSFTEETDITKSSLTIELSGADLTFISTALNENIVNDSVVIYRGLLDANNSIIADPLLLYQGTIDTYAISESEKESALALTVVSHWADFDKKSGRLTNKNSQQRFFSTDTGMEFSSQTVLDIKWGRK